MEGILGVISENPSSDLYKMYDKLSHRGILQKRLYQGQAFGQQTSEHTKNFEEFDGFFTISDCRIDNKDELIRLLEIKDQEISDNLLFIHAYKKWGVKFGNHLTGAFAIAIWEAETQKLTLLRDYTGIRSLYYFFNEAGKFAFASEPKSILFLDFVPKALNQNKIETYLEWPSDQRPYTGQTFYEHIQNVLPGTSLTINLATNKKSINFYWEIDSKKYVTLKTESDFVDAFKKAFTRAIKRRIKTDGQIASHLSGGLDSSSICVTANELLKSQRKVLNTIHYDTKNSYCNETDYAKEVLKTGTYNHCWVQRSNSFENDLNEFQHKIQQPDPHTVSLGIFKKNENAFYKTNGVKVVLTGHDGDTTLDKGLTEFILLLKQSKIKEFKKILLEVIENKDLTSLYLEWNEWPLEKKLKKYTEVFLFSSINQVFREQGTLNAIKLTLELIKENLADKKVIFILLEKAIKLTFKAKKTKQTDFPYYSPKTLNNIQLRHFHRITCAAIVESNEIFDLISSHEDFHYCHPFQDKDLMELCLFTPFNLKFFNGMGRGPIRLAMKNLLPEKVRNRTSKVNFVPLIQDNLLLIKPPIPKSLAQSKYAERFDLTHITSQYMKLKTKSNFYSKDINHVQRAHFFSEWLQNVETLDSNSHETGKATPGQ
jgi:asparagine synthase (glutamine-hydrolysing)